MFAEARRRVAARKMRSEITQGPIPNRKIGVKRPTTRGEIQADWRMMQIPLHRPPIVLKK